MNAYPLKFEPIFKQKVGGGRNLERLFGKQLPAGELVGESWELVDLEQGQSVAAMGAAQGQTLGELVRQWGKNLLGNAGLFEGRFPLLIKFLDAEQNLSVQVHPDQAMARKLGGNVRVKHEAWYILEARGDAAIYRGLSKGVGRTDLAAAIAGGCVEEALQRIAVKPGQCYYLPSGTLHALGAGVVVAEVQTPSDVTYRIYDWGRQGRQLHIAEAMECIAFDAAEPDQPRSHVADMWTTVTRLVACESFVMRKVRTVAGIEQPAGGGAMAVWIGLAGSAKLICEPAGLEVELGAGQVVLLPAGLTGTRVSTASDCEWLEVTVPAREGT